jgi:O-acetyl-ADP-ribose deacetylase (regulator of RNase III)
MLNYINGDIFKAKEDILLHGCNCFLTMGAGIAKKIAQLYPEAQTVDKQTVLGDKEKLGHYSYCKVSHIHYNQPLVIVNCYTQYGFSKFEPAIDYKALAKCLYLVNQNFKKGTICMPKIGAGLAGGNWNTIERIINGIFVERTINVYLYQEAIKNDKIWHNTLNIEDLE